jgi:hypothetical protein
MGVKRLLFVGYLSLDIRRLKFSHGPQLVLRYRLCRY